jgi:hypothetical protein
MTYSEKEEGRYKYWPTTILRERGLSVTYIRNKIKCTCSESGPHSSGPTQYPATNKDIVSTAASSEKWNWAISSGMMLDGAELANVLKSRLKHLTRR